MKATANLHDLGQSLWLDNIKLPTFSVRSMIKPAAWMAGFRWKSPHC